MFSILPDVVRAYEGDADGELVLRDFSTQSYQTQVKALREHRLDALFALKPFDEPGTEHTCVARTFVVCVLPVGHRLAHLDALPSTALAEEAWVWMSRPTFPRAHDEVIQLCRIKGFEPKIVRTVPQAQAIVCRPFLDFSYEVELYVLWRQNDHSPLLRIFLRRCKGDTEAS